MATVVESTVELDSSGSHSGDELLADSRSTSPENGETDADMEHERRTYYRNQQRKESDEQSCVDLQMYRPTYEDAAVDRLVATHGGNVVENSTIELLDGVCDAIPSVEYPCQLEKIHVEQMTRFCSGTQTTFDAAAADDMLARFPRLAERMPCLPPLVSTELRFVVDVGCLLKVGIGTNGIVLLGMALADRQLVAIKLIPKWSCSSASVLIEASITARISETNVTPKFYGIAILEENNRFKRACLVSEFIGDARSLAVTDMNYLLQAGLPTSPTAAGHRSLTMTQWLAFLVKCVDNVERIHKIGVIVNDIKTDNILCRRTADHWQPLFIDFGSSVYGRADVSFRFVAQRSSDSDAVGAAQRRHEHIAPELFADGHSCETSDVFAVGRVLATAAYYLQSQAIAGIAQGCQQQALEARHDLATVRRMLKQADKGQL